MAETATETPKQRMDACVEEAQLWWKRTRRLMYACKRWDAKNPPPHSAELSRIELDFLEDMNNKADGVRLNTSFHHRNTSTELMTARAVHAAVVSSWVFEYAAMCGIKRGIDVERYRTHECKTDLDTSDDELKQRWAEDKARQEAEAVEREEQRQMAAITRPIDRARRNVQRTRVVLERCVRWDERNPDLVYGNPQIVQWKFRDVRESIAKCEERINEAHTIVSEVKSSSETEKYNLAKSHATYVDELAKQMFTGMHRLTFSRKFETSDVNAAHDNDNDYEDYGTDFDDESSVVSEGLDGTGEEEEEDEEEDEEEE